MEFKADAKNLLKNLKSLYKQDDIFFRELISNSIDAGARRIFVTNCDSGYLWFCDDGCGMDGEELHKYIGSIASTSKGGEKETIGQFGLGFYSSFIVSDEVEVISKKSSDSKIYYWKNIGQDKYDVGECSQEQRNIVDSLFGAELPPSFCAVGLKLAKQAQQYLVKQQIMQRVSKYFQLHRQPVNFLEVNKASGKRTMIRCNEELNDTPKQYIYQGKICVGKFTLNFSVLKVCNIDVFEQDIDKWQRISLFIQDILVTDNLQSISKMCLVHDFMKFLKIQIIAKDVQINVSRDTIKEEDIRDLLHKFTVQFLLYLIEQQEKNPKKYLEFYNHYFEFLFLGALYSHQFKDLIVNLLRFTVIDEQGTIEKTQPLTRMTGKKIYFAENTPQYVQLIRQLRVAAVLTESPQEFTFMQSLVHFNGAQVLLFSQKEFAELQQISEQQKRVAQYITETINDTLQVSPKIQDVYFQDYRASDDAGLDDGGQEQCFFASLDLGTNKNNAFQCIILTVNTNNETTKRLQAQIANVKKLNAAQKAELNNAIMLYYCFALEQKDLQIHSSNHKVAYRRRVLGLLNSAVKF